ncbi:hypothetical protein ACFPM7_24505 [Actinokineospora guangxiensis]|uniref:Uncharacterized protein n=1 Tax=Actinokineospora guangxiensis TaxID=1490288 RepID=A0ABW0ETK3_9PSEU
MFLALWITCGAALAGLVVWRLRVAATTLRTILAETPDTDAPDISAGAQPAAEPAGLAWPHPPRRLWADR